MNCDFYANTISFASLFVATFWIGVIYFSEFWKLITIFPLLVFMDSTSMAILFMGAMMFFWAVRRSSDNSFHFSYYLPEYIWALTIEPHQVNLLQNPPKLFLSKTVRKIKSKLRFST